MTFNPCIIIPIYNHGELLVKSIPEILAYDIPVIIIDDGSNKKTQDILVEISKNQNVTIYHIKKNEGKGAALLFGFSETFKQKFSHALQIDADNQHCIKDIELFLQLSEKNPHALINSYPVYDKTVPKSRLYGRKLTNFWVMVETFSLKIKDSMCGFRVYPLKEVLSIIEATPIHKRMGFDIDIIVKLHWHNVDIINQKTQVIYPEDGVSHFRILKDNLEITSLHVKLFAGMLMRLPSLIKRLIRNK